jgi:hypothetical protein
LPIAATPLINYVVTTCVCGKGVGFNECFAQQANIRNVRNACVAKINRYYYFSGKTDASVQINPHVRAVVVSCKKSRVVLFNGFGLAVKAVFVNCKANFVKITPAVEALKNIREVPTYYVRCPYRPER